MKHYIKSLDKRAFLALLIAFMLGVIWVVAIRFVTVSKKETHYHANFAIFVNGERLPFDRFTFYEEVQACGGDEVNNPRTRAHMHDKVNHVIHVHDTAATWGHFFANLGFALGDTVVKTDTDTFVESETTAIDYVLNGQAVETIANRTITSEDTLLISVNENSVSPDLDAQYAQITQDAAEYNKRNDPSNCTGGKPLTFTERFKLALGIE